MARHKFTRADAVIGGVVVSHVAGHMAKIGRRGARALTREQRAASGRNGGKATAKKHGREWFRELARRSAEARRRKSR